MILSGARVDDNRELWSGLGYKPEQILCGAEKEPKTGDLVSQVWILWCGEHGVTPRELSSGTVEGYWRLNAKRQLLLVNDQASGKSVLTVHITIEDHVRVRMIELGVNPSAVLRTALGQAIKKKEE